MVRDIVNRFAWLLGQFGIDPRRALRALRGLPRYVRDLFRFRAGYSGRFQLLPCLDDWHGEGGTTKSEYFWQDLIVARMIFEAKPQKHVDVGSRVDGFVAHVASFREIEVFDVRPISTPVPGITFRTVDLMESVEDMTEYCDSLSCLHALEHFGLGRYGDPVDVNGFERGLANMAGMLRADGVLYLSVPIGIDRVEFNAHRVSDPRVVIESAARRSLEFSGLTVIRGGNVEIAGLGEAGLRELAGQKYALGIFVFEKKRPGGD